MHRRHQPALPHRDRRAQAGRRARHTAPPVTLMRLAHASCSPPAGGARRSRSCAGAASALALAPINAWPVLFLTFPILVWLVDGSAAGRWSGVWHAAARRLVLRLRLFPRRALLDRLRLPGRCQDLRLAAADRGRRACRPIWRSTPGSASALARLIWVRGAVARAGAGGDASPAPNGCAAICSADFPGTPSAMRSPSRWRWRKAYRWSASGV